MSRTPVHRRSTLLLAAALAVVLSVALSATLAACGSSSSTTTAVSTTTPAPVTVRLGYFPNLTHATALVGVESGTFATALAPDTLETKTFNAGPAAVEALFSGALDAAYVGPNPAVNAFQKSDGKAIRIISGATSGGASLVVAPSVTSAADLKGKKIGSPQLGGTQDVALRAWLSEQGLKTDVNGGGEVSIQPQENAQSLETFRAGTIAGAWVPEPWATRLVQEGGGKVLVDEKDLWPGGRFVTTHLIVRTEFLDQHPATVKRLLQGQVTADQVVHDDPTTAKALANQGIAKITGKPLSAKVVDSAWDHLQFTNDPIASSLTTSATHAKALGLLPSTELKGIYDLRLLNEVLKGAGQPEVASA